MAGRSSQPSAAAPRVTESIGMARPRPWRRHGRGLSLFAWSVTHPIRGERVRTEQQGLGNVSARLEGQERFSAGFLPCNVIGLMSNFAKIGWGAVPPLPGVSGRLQSRNGTVPDRTGAVFYRTGAALYRTGAVLYRAGAVLYRAGAVLYRAGHVRATLSRARSQIRPAPKYSQLHTAAARYDADIVRPIHATRRKLL